MLANCQTHSQAELNRMYSSQLLLILFLLRYGLCLRTCKVKVHVMERFSTLKEDTLESCSGLAHTEQWRSHWLSSLHPPKCRHSQRRSTQPGQEAGEKATSYESGVLLFGSRLDSNFLHGLGQDHFPLWTSVFFKWNKRLGLDDFKGVSELLK